MRPDDAEALDELERDHELGELVRRVRRAISMGRLDQAEQYAARALELAPNTTTVEELLGDVAMARGEFVAARDHFRRAIEIEPANADAEAKYGEAVLKIGNTERLRERLEEVAENPQEYEPFRRNPVTAAFWSVIPGLGQLYNHEYEKGLAMIGAAAVLLAWLLARLLTYSGATLIAEARNPRLDVEGAEQIVQGYGPLTWTLIVLAILAYLALWVWSIVDAYRVCAEQAKQADVLGVEG